MMQEPQPDNAEFQVSRRYPDVRHVWGVTGLTIAAVMGTAGLLALDVFGKLMIVLSEVAIIVPTLIFLRVARFPYRPILRLKPIDRRTGVLSVVIGIALPVVTNTIDTVVESRFPMPELWKQAMEGLLIIHSLDELVIIVAGLVVGAAVFEELFFRGFLQSTLEWRYGPSWAIGLASLTFGFVHTNPWWFPSILLAGAVCGVLAYISGSVYPGIIVHGMNNGLSLLVLNTKQSERFRWLSALEDVSAPTALVSVAVLTASLVWFAKQKRLGD